MSGTLTGDKHPGWHLSRECIQDTIIAKRAGVFRSGGVLLPLVSANLKLLRETQLAPHIEAKMIACRYSKMNLEKTAAPDIVIVLRGGIIQTVCSTNPYTRIFVADYDIDAPDDDEIETREIAEERIAQGDMQAVY